MILDTLWKILFSKKQFGFFTTPGDPPPWFGKRPYFFWIFFFNPSLSINDCMNIWIQSNSFHTHKLISEYVHYFFWHIQMSDYIGIKKPCEWTSEQIFVCNVFCDFQCVTGVSLEIPPINLNWQMTMEENVFIWN